MRVHAVERWMDFSQPFANLRDFSGHAKVRSTPQRRGSTLKPLWSSQRLTTSMVGLHCPSAIGPAVCNLGIVVFKTDC